MKIAIVEDDASSRDDLVTALKRYQKENSLLLDLTFFDDGLVFIKGYQPVFDLVFMDIEMPHMNGLDAAKKLREIDDSVSLVFVTNLKQFATRGYEVEALDFIVKPIQYGAFFATMKRVEKRNLRANKAEIVLKTGAGIHRFAIADILYLEVFRHTVIYHTKNGDISLWGSLTEEAAKLPLEDFAYCNSCYLVNLSYVSRISGSEVFLGQKSLKMSRGKKSEFMEQLSHHIAEG